MVQPILMDVEAALQGKDLGDGVRYESQQFELVASLLLDAPAPHAVPWVDLAAAVGGAWAEILFLYRSPWHQFFCNRCAVVRHFFCFENL